MRHPCSPVFGPKTDLPSSRTGVTSCARLGEGEENMTRAIRWTDEWVRGLEHPREGERVYRDPTMARHRLVVKVRKKVFEVQAERPRQYGARKTWVVQVGEAPMCCVNAARTKAIEVLSAITQGGNPHPKAAAPAVTTLGGAWGEYAARGDLRPSTRSVYEGSYQNNLAHWADLPLKTLVDHPVMARDLHRQITARGAPSEANHTLRLLRSIYRHAARLDTSLSRVRHPCEAVEWHQEKKRVGAAIPSELMPAWAAQIDAMRASRPIRASFQILNLRLGTRPGELARAKWEDFDWQRDVLVLPETKTHLVEVPLTDQIRAELELVRVAGQDLFPGSPYVFPANSATGYIRELMEQKAVLSHSGNCGRHTHHTIGTVLGVQHGIDEIVLDVLEGRSLLKSSLAGRGYIDRSELGPKVRAAQHTINHEIDRLFGYSANSGTHQLAAGVESSS
jgi:integrase